MKTVSRKNTKLLYKLKHLLLDLYEKLETRTGKRILVTALVFSLIILIMTILIRKTKHNFPEPVTMALMDTTLEDIGDYSDLTTPAIDFDYHSYDKIASDSFSLNQGTCKNPVLGGLLLKSNDSFSPVCLGYFITAKFLIFSSDCKYLADDLSESDIGFDSSSVVLELTDIIRVESIGLKGVKIVELNEPRNDYDGSTCIYEQFDSNMYLVDDRNDADDRLIPNSSNCFNSLSEPPFLLNNSNCLDVPSRLRDYLNGTNDRRRFFFSFVRTETGGQYLNGVYYKSDESGLDEFFPIKKYLNEITDLLENSRKRISFTSSVTAFTTSMSTYEQRTPESNTDSKNINITLLITTTPKTVREETTTKATKTITTSTSTTTIRTTSITKTRTITSKITTTTDTTTNTKTVTVTTTPKRTTITTTTATKRTTLGSTTKRTTTTTRTTITTITKTRTTSTRTTTSKTTSTTTKMTTRTSSTTTTRTSATSTTTRTTTTQKPTSTTTTLRTTTKKSTTTTAVTISKYSKSNLPIQTNLNSLFATNKKLLNFTSSPITYLTSNVSLATVNITSSLRSKSRKYSAEANQSYMLNYGDDCPVTLVPMFKLGIAMVCVGYQITSKFFIYPNSCIPPGVNLSEVIVSPYNHITSLSDHYRIIDVPYRYDKLSIIEIEPDSIPPGTYKINCLQPKNDTTSDITLRSGYRKPNQTGFVHHFTFLAYGQNCFSTKINNAINISTTACENMAIKLREKLKNSSVTYYDKSDFISVIRISNTSNRYFNGIYSMAENPINDVFMPIQSFYNLIEEFLDRKRDEFYNEP